MRDKIIQFLNENYIDTGYYQTEDSIQEGYTVELLDKLKAEELVKHLNIEQLIEDEEIE